MGKHWRGWAVGVALGAVILGGLAVASQTRHTAPAKRTAAGSQSNFHVSLEQIAAGKTYGVRTAPITIEEFSDFECPACRELYLQTLQQLLADNLIAQGKVYLVHHDFPLPVHQYARTAALYANAAAAIGRFESVERALFARQPEWAANGKVREVVASALTATEMRRVDALVRSPEIAAAVDRDIALGRQNGVERTPTMFITYRGRRQPVVGVVSYPILRRYLEALLATR